MPDISEVLEKLDKKIKKPSKGNRPYSSNLINSYVSGNATFFRNNASEPAVQQGILEKKEDIINADPVKINEAILKTENRAETKDTKNVVEDSGAESKIAQSISNLTKPKADKRQTRMEQQASINFIESVSEKLSIGYSRIPHSILMKALGSNLSRGAMSCLLAIIRLTLGFSREETQISNSVLADMTSLPLGSRTREYVNELIDLGFIKKELTSYGGAPKIKILLSASDKEMLKLGETEKSETIIDINSVKNKTILDYINSIKRADKRASELRKFVELSKDYSEDQIGAALRIIKSQDDFKNIHSPISFLCHAIEDVLALGEASFKVAKVENVISSSSVDELSLSAKSQALSSDEMARVFESQIPNTDERESILLGIVKDKYQSLMINPTGTMARNLALLYWYKNNYHQIGNA